MAKNKKAQILAAVMCAATVAGISPAVSSAAEFIADEDGRAYVATHNNSIEGYATNDITFTVGNNTLAVNNNATTIGGVTIGADGAIEQQYKGFRVNANGDVTARSVTVDGFKIDSPDGAYLDISGTKIYKDGGFSTGNMNFNVRPNGDLQMGPDNKFTVQAATGNVITEGNINDVHVGTFNGEGEGRDGDVVFTAEGEDPVNVSRMSRNTAGIERSRVDAGGWQTTIEGKTTIDDKGNLTTNTLSIGKNPVTGEPAFTVNDEGFVRTEYGGDIGGVLLNGGRVVATTGISAADGQFSVDGTTGTVSTTNVTTAEGADLNAMNDTLTGYENAGIVAGTNNGEYNTVMGDGSWSNGDYNTAIGNQANIDGSYGVALGAHATVVGNNSVAIGYNSQALRDDVVSVGSFGQERQITNVAAGTEDTDAVNVAQLKDVQTDVDEINANVAGITRTGSEETGYTTDIEGVVSVSDNGLVNIGQAGDGTGVLINATTGDVIANQVSANKVATEELSAGNGKFRVDENGDVLMQNGQGESISMTTGGLNLMTVGNGTGMITLDNGAVKLMGGGVNTVTVDGNGTKFSTVGGTEATTIQGGTVTADTDVQLKDGTSLAGLKEQVGNMDTDMSGLQSKVDGIQQQVDGISRVENEDGSHTTVINEDTSIKGDLNVDGTLTVGGKEIATGDDITAVDNKVGDLSSLTTTDKSNVVGAVNEVNGKVDEVSGKVDKVASDVGNKEDLNNSIKEHQEYKDNQSLVGAINAESAMRQELTSRVDGLDSRVSSLEDRMGDVEDRIDKVGAMAAAIANLRTMGYDPEAPTEIAVGVGQYESETGLALGVFHYPNQDFMLSASISTSGDEVMGGIGATWKIGRKTAAEKERSIEEKRVEKAEEMQELAKAEKVNAQRERHAKMLAERQQQEA
ncbi:YadA-like family protein [Megamonas sp.]